MKCNPFGHNGSSASLATTTRAAAPCAPADVQLRPQKAAGRKSDVLRTASPGGWPASPLLRGDEAIAGKGCKVLRSTWRPEGDSRRDHPAHPPASPAQGLRLPSGNRLSAQQRLDTGSCSGSLRLVAHTGCRLRVVRSAGKGRGSAPCAPLLAGALVCALTGRLVEGDKPQQQPAHGARIELFHVRAPRAGVPGRWLVLDPPSAAAPGNLINTSTDGANNVRFSYKPGSCSVVVRMTRAVAAGEELLAAYGAAYTRMLRAAASAAQAAAAAAAAAEGPVTAPCPFTVVTCSLCSARMQHKDLARHAVTFACAARQRTREP